MAFSGVLAIAPLREVAGFICGGQALGDRPAHKFESFPYTLPAGSMLFLVTRGSWEMKAEPTATHQIMERILELSADAQIMRKTTASNSPLFHALTGAVGAYGKVLEVLVEVQQREELLAAVGQLSWSDDSAAALAN